MYKELTSIQNVFFRFHYRRNILYFQEPNNNLFYRNLLTKSTQKIISHIDFSIGFFVDFENSILGHNQIKYIELDLDNTIVNTGELSIQDVIPNRCLISSIVSVNYESSFPKYTYAIIDWKNKRELWRKSGQIDIVDGVFFYRTDINSFQVKLINDFGHESWSIEVASLGQYEEWSDEKSENVVMPGKVKRFLAVIDDVLIAVLSNESTLAVDVNSGKILWHITEEIKIADKRSKRLFVISSKNYFEIDLKTGNKIDSFSFENGGSPFPVKSIADNFVFNETHIFLYDSDMKSSTIGAFNNSTKKFDWIHKLDGFIPVGKSLIAENNYLCVVEQVKGQNNLLVFEKALQV